MTVTNILKNLESRTMTITAEFDAPVDRVWQIWSDPRQLERWWGPPTFPATVMDHDLTPGGSVTYFMTGPDGEKHRGWWKVIAVQAPSRLEFEDGFADDAGDPNTDLPVTTTRVTLTELSAAGTRMEIESLYTSRDALEQVLAMGMEEGITAALGQIAPLLAEGGVPTKTA